MKNLEQHIQLVEETVNHFNLSNRGVGKVAGLCSYFNPETGNKCAVGRCMTDDVARVLGDMAVSPKSLKNRLDIARGVDTDEIYGISDDEAYGELVEIGNITVLDDIFKEEYRGFKVSLWQELQLLHDNNQYWTENGLNNSGKLKKETIIKWLKKEFKN